MLRPVLVVSAVLLLAPPALAAQGTAPGAPGAKAIWTPAPVERPSVVACRYGAC